MRPNNHRNRKRRPQQHRRQNTRRPNFARRVIPLGPVEAPKASFLFADSSIEFMPALFSIHPDLIGRLPWVSLRGCEEPSIPARIYHSQHLFGKNYAFMKRESLDAYVLPDNKAKKLEFILGRALLQKKKQLVTFGFVGSSHCLAVAKAAQVLGLKAEIALLKGPLEASAIEKVAAMKGMGAKVRFFSSWKGIGIWGAWKWFLSKFFPTEIIAPGGSDFVGTLGYLSSFLELKQQMQDRQIPKPDMVFVAAGSGASLVGMTLSKYLAGLEDVKIIGIQTSDDRGVELERLVTMGNEAIAYLNQFQKKPIELTLSKKDFHIVRDYLYEGHGLLPPHVERWKCRMEELELIQLDRTYTAKALYGMSDYLSKNKIQDKNVFFWNTYSPFRASDLHKGFTYRKVPYRLRRWIREEQAEGGLVEIGQI